MVPIGGAIFYTSPAPKLPYQSIPNFKRMITSVKQRELPNLVAIGFTGAAPPLGKICSYRFSVFFLLSFFLFRQLTYRPQFATDFDVLWLKDVVWRKDVPFECLKCYNQL